MIYRVEEQQASIVPYKVYMKLPLIPVWWSGFLATNYFAIGYYTKAEALAAITGYIDRFTLYEDK
jgi:hypothetical protein